MEIKRESIQNMCKQPQKKIKKQQVDYRSQKFQNPEFKYYYQIQLRNCFQSIQQFQQFWDCLKSKLHITFRLNQTMPHQHTFYSKLLSQQFIHNLLGINQIQHQSLRQQIQKVVQIKQAKWKKGIFTIKCNKSKLKKQNMLNPLHQLIMKADYAGLITRQQIASMLPPIFLNCQPNDLILDMCAAPGSKTSQILQQLQKQLFPQGGVVANDIEYSRAMMLSHQVNRGKTMPIVVVNYPAQNFPSIISQQTGKQILYDKVLADVPCSGDGATRKLPNKWFDWNTNLGLNLHPLQLSIVLRGLQLLKPGGVMLYSTCSLNPIQNQSVISQLFSLLQPGSIKLIDIHGKSSRGLKQWKVLNKKGNPNGRTKKQNITEPMFQQIIDENRKNLYPLPLQKMQQIKIQNCMRILPHYQDTGGFFIVLIEKQNHFKLKKSKPNQIININKQNKKNKKKTQKAKYQKFINIDDKQFQQISSYFGLDPQLKELLFVKQGQGSKKKTVSLVSKSIRNIIKSGIQRIINSGSRCFIKNKNNYINSECSYRICQDSVRYIFPYINKRKLYVNESQFKWFIEKKKFQYEQLEEKIVLELKGLGQGCIVICIKQYQDALVVLNYNNGGTLLVSDQQLQGYKLRYL